VDTAAWGWPVGLLPADGVSKQRSGLVGQMTWAGSDAMVLGRPQSVKALGEQVAA
jgi:hypothetical protein